MSYNTFNSGEAWHSAGAVDSCDSGSVASQGECKAAVDSRAALEHCSVFGKRLFVFGVMFVFGF